MQTLRLLKTYRGYRLGEVIKATPGLAAILIGNGTAVLDGQRSLLVDTPERAVSATARMVETR